MPQTRASARDKNQMHFLLKSRRQGEETASIIPFIYDSHKNHVFELWIILGYSL